MLLPPMSVQLSLVLFMEVAKRQTLKEHLLAKSAKTLKTEN
jgi:hypothetical protein